MILNFLSRQRFCSSVNYLAFTYKVVLPGVDSSFYIGFAYPGTTK